MTKTDYKKELDCYRARQGDVRMVEVPPLKYLMIDGHGDPNVSPDFGTAIGVLYPVAYKLKFLSKASGLDHVVMPLEGLWWAEDMDSFTARRDKSAWSWTLMIMVPDTTTRAMFDEAVSVVAPGVPAADSVRWEVLDEGLSVQTLHVGPFDEEGPLLERMHHEFIPAHGLTMTGRHHEIYLSDRRRTAPERLRTILRQPVARVG